MIFIKHIKSALNSFLVTVLITVSTLVHASRDAVEPVFNAGVTGLFNWTQRNATEELVRALQLFTPSAREQALVALEKSKIIAIARKEDASVMSSLLTTATIQESVDAKGLLNWTLSSPLKIFLKRGDKTIFETVLVANARVVTWGKPGAVSYKIDSVWFVEDKSVSGK